MATPSRKTQATPQQEANQRRKTRLRPVVKGEADLVALVDAEGNVTYISPAIVPILGYSPKAIVGTRLSALAHPDDRAAMQQMVKDVGRSPNKSLKATYRLHAKDGSVRWVESNATNLLQVPGVSAIIIHFHKTPESELAPRSNWRQMQTAEHFVQFYEDDAFLLQALAASSRRAYTLAIAVLSLLHRRTATLWKRTYARAA